MLLALTHTLVAERLHDEAFLARYCVGFERVRAYLLGETDGQPKDAAWAAAITGVPADTIRALARRMAATRTMLTASWSLQRADHGEQPYWAVILLAACLGQIGLPGGGFGFGYGSTGGMAEPPPVVRAPVMETLANPLAKAIPAARIADCLLNPGERYDFNGRSSTYPDIRLVYWAGGNPFHHHQDINRLRARVAAAGDDRRARAVVDRDRAPRRHRAAGDDDARAQRHRLRAARPLRARDAAGDRAGRRGAQRLRDLRRSRAPARLRRRLRRRARRDRRGCAISTSAGARARAPIRPRSRSSTASGRTAGWRSRTAPTTTCCSPISAPIPDKHRLATPSGRIELYSERIAGFGYDDCPPHPDLDRAGRMARRRRGRRPFRCTSSPASRATGCTARWTPARSAPPARSPAARRSRSTRTTRGGAASQDGDLVRVFNARGACLAGAQLTDAIRPGVVRLSCGAWYDPATPDDGALCAHGNANMLTRDRGTSRLGQGPTCATTLVEIERWSAAAPEVRAFAPPQRVTESV